jgi:hypothetical protein
MTPSDNSDGTYLDLGTAHRADVVIRPALIEEGHGYYFRDLQEVAADMRSGGATVVFQHDAGHREWLDRRGPIADMVVEIVVGIASGAGLQALTWAITRMKGEKDSRLDVTVHLPGGPEDGVRIQGSPEAVAEALNRLRPPGDGDGSDDGGTAR